MLLLGLRSLDHWPPARGRGPQALACVCARGVWPDPTVPPGRDTHPEDWTRVLAFPQSVHGWVGPIFLSDSEPPVKNGFLLFLLRVVRKLLNGSFSF